MRGGRKILRGVVAANWGSICRGAERASWSRSMMAGATRMTWAVPGEHEQYTHCGGHWWSVPSSAGHGVLQQPSAFAGVVLAANNGDAARQSRMKKVSARHISKAMIWQYPCRIKARCGRVGPASKLPRYLGPLHDGRFRTERFFRPATVSLEDAKKDSSIRSHHRGANAGTLPMVRCILQSLETTTR